MGNAFFELWWQPLEAEQCGQNLHFLHIQVDLQHLLQTV
jgi:hypothetical protein